MKIEAARALLTVMGVAALADVPSLPPASLAKCEQERAEAHELEQKAGRTYEVTILYMCEYLELRRLTAPGAELTTEEARWLAARNEDRQLREKEQQVREERVKLLIAGYLASTAISGIVLAWLLGRFPRRPRRWWTGFAIYLTVSFALFLAVSLVADGSARIEKVAAGLVAHAHWAALLLVIAFRKALKSFISTGWGRIFIVAWAIWAAWFAFGLHKSLGNESDVLRFTCWGLFVPVAFALAVRWIVRGFRYAATKAIPAVIADGEGSIGPTQSGAARGGEDESTDGAGLQNRLRAAVPTTAPVPGLGTQADGVGADRRSPAARPIAAADGANAGLQNRPTVTRSQVTNDSAVRQASEMQAQESKPTSRVWIVALKVATPIVTLLGLGLLMGPAKSCGRHIGKEVGYAIGTATRPTLPSQWTPEWTLKLVQKDFNIGIPMSDRDREEIARCMVSEFTSTIPGGPEAVQKLGQKRAEEVASDAGRKCGKELQRRIMSSEVWTPVATSIVAKACESSLEGATPDYCACLSREIPKRYPTPAAFKAVNENPGVAATPREQARMKAVTAACARTLK